MFIASTFFSKYNGLLTSSKSYYIRHDQPKFNKKRGRLSNKKKANIPKRLKSTYEGDDDWILLTCPLPFIWLETTKIRQLCLPFLLASLSTKTGYFQNHPLQEQVYCILGLKNSDLVRLLQRCFRTPKLHILFVGNLKLSWTLCLQGYTISCHTRRVGGLGCGAPQRRIPDTSVQEQHAQHQPGHGKRIPTQQLHDIPNADEFKTGGYPSIGTREFLCFLWAQSPKGAIWDRTSQYASSMFTQLLMVYTTGFNHRRTFAGLQQVLDFRRGKCVHTFNAGIAAEISIGRKRTKAMAASSRFLMNGTLTAVWSVTSFRRIAIWWRQWVPKVWEDIKSQRQAQLEERRDMLGTRFLKS